MKVSVKPERALAADLPAIRALLDTCGLPSSDLTDAHLPLFRVLRNGSLVGSAGLEVAGDAGLLRSLAVRNELRSRGYGGMLLAEIEGLARERGVGSLYLLTTTAPDYFAAQGFRRIARADAPAALQSTAEFKALCPGSAVCMVKPL